MTYKTGELVDIGDIVLFRNEKAVVNQIYNDYLIIMGTDKGKRYGNYGTNGITFLGRKQK